MSSYTMQLKAIVEGLTQDQPELNHNDKIELARHKIFNFDYPFFDELYRPIFERNIIKEFYFREIGFETEGIFRFRLEHWMTVNMPYFNKLFESELLKYNPLHNSQMQTTHKKDIDKTSNEKGTANLKANTEGSSNSDSTGTAKTKDDDFNRNIQTDNPDTRLAITTKDGKGVIEYASSIEENKVNNNRTQDRTDKTDTDSKAKSESDQASNFESKGNELENYVQNRTGKIGVQSYAKMVQDYRNALLRVEVQIHTEMQQLFMLVY